MLEDFKANKFDVVLGGITVNPARAEVGDFSMVVNGRRTIACCEDQSKYATVDAINQPSTRVIVNPGGTNDRFRA